MKKRVTRSKIVCTIGPASDSEETLRGMFKSGMDVCRLNFSHGTHKEHIDRFNRIRSITDKHAIMFDIAGPKIRTGIMEEKVWLNRGDRITLTSRDVTGDASIVSVSYENLPKEVEPGDKIFINDGIIELKVLSTDGVDVECEVISGGELSDRKGLNCPDVKLSVTVPTEKDIEDLKLAAKLDPDYIAISFVTSSKEVKKIKEILMDEGNPEIRLISKIERPIALKNLSEIIKISDGIMVARGDLGVEIPPEKVPIVQKEIIYECNVAGKPVITATQMLESMTTNPLPTRAEVTDVANAVLDGTDAVMLSAETATGAHPVRVVQIMNRIAENAEDAMPYRDPSYYDSEKRTIAEIIGHAVHEITNELFESGKKECAIITITQTGYSARMIAKYRAPAPIFAVTPDPRVMRALSLLWGVETLQMEPVENTDQMTYLAVKHSFDEGYIARDDTVVIVSGSPLIPGGTNHIDVFVVDDVLSSGYKVTSPPL